MVIASLLFSSPESPISYIAPKVNGLMKTNNQQTIETQ